MRLCTLNIIILTIHSTKEFITWRCRRPLICTYLRRSPRLPPSSQCLLLREKLVRNIYQPVWATRARRRGTDLGRAFLAREHWLCDERRLWVTQWVSLWVLVAVVAVVAGAAGVADVAVAAVVALVAVVACCLGSLSWLSCSCLCSRVLHLLRVLRKVFYLCGAQVPQV